MTAIDINALSAEQKAEFLKQFSAEDLKATLKTAEDKKSEDRKAYKDSVNEAIPVAINALKTVSLALQLSKLDVFQTLKILLDLKAEAYDIKQGQQSHTFSDDKGNSIAFGFRVNDGWDDTVNAGIDKIKEVIDSLAKDDNSAKLVSAIDKLLKKDSKGNLKASRVLELKQLAQEFDDAKFTDAVEIISQAYKPVRSAFFIEGYTTDASGKKNSIPLSITAVDFPTGTVIEDLFPIEKSEAVELEKSEA